MLSIIIPTLQKSKDTLYNLIDALDLDSKVDEIIVIDIRKDTKSVASIISEYGITDALIINNVQGATSLMGYLKNKVMS